MAPESPMTMPITRRGTFALALGLAALPARGTGLSEENRDWRPLDRAAEAAVRDRLTPGIQLGVMARGTLVYSKAFGLANLETATPFTRASVSRVGSLTKQFTAAAILLLAEDGSLRVDDRLSRFLPEVPHAGEVTLRHLLTHTSGLGLSVRVPELVLRTEHDSPSLLAAILSRNPVLHHPPGARWIYNNLGYRLLGLVIERASGLSYSAFIRNRLAGRAGLPRTAVDQDREVVGGRASGYVRDPAAPLGFSHVGYGSITWPGAAGALRSTAEDLCRWHQALLGGRLLRRPSLEAMLTPVRLDERPPSTDVAEWGPEGPADRKQYGLGIYSGVHEGRRQVTHTGSIEGFLSRLTSYPAEQVSVAGIINVDRGDEGRASAHESALRSALQLGASIALR